MSESMDNNQPAPEPIELDDDGNADLGLYIMFLGLM